MTGTMRARAKPGSGAAQRPLPVSPGPSGRRGLGWLITPALVATALAALFYYLHRQHLDSIEARALATPLVLQQLRQHVELTAASTAAVICLAVPAGIMLTRPRSRPVRPVVLAVANIGQAVPSIGLLVLLAFAIGFGFGPAVIALVAYSVLPVLRNTMTGLEGVDKSLIETGRGVGMSARTILWRVEIPLAVPVMLAGIRTALILNVGTATLASFTNGGGLGNLIDVGITLNRTPVLMTGAVLTAALALTIDWLAEVTERLIRPRGL